MSGAGRRSTRQRATHASVLAAFVLVTAGCQYLYGFPMDPDSTFRPPTPAYVEGLATVTIGSEAAIVLDTLTRPGTFDTMLGGEVSFRGPDGWSLQVLGAMGAGGAGGAGGFFTPQTAWIQLDRIVDGQHWTVLDPSRCIVTAQADPFALRGTATCRGLRWSDALGGGYALGPTYIPDQPAFDAEITFEASSRPTQSG